MTREQIISDINELANKLGTSYAASVLQALAAAMNCGVEDQLALHVVPWALKLLSILKQDQCGLTIDSTKRPN